MNIEHKLTGEERMRVFLLYFGSDALIDYPTNKGKRKINFDYLTRLGDFGSQGETLAYDWRWQKLLLTPLLSISDEHALVIGRMYNYHLVDNEKNKKLIIDAGKMLSKVVLNSDYRIVQYLIQQGYAVPLFFDVNHWANGKTAIELGIAIDRTTLSQQSNQ